MSDRDCDDASGAMGFDTRLYDLAMNRIMELERELIYARRGEMSALATREDLIRQRDSMKEQRYEMFQEIGRLPAPPEDFGDGPYERVEWTLALLEGKEKPPKGKGKKR